MFSSLFEFLLEVTHLLFGLIQLNHLRVYILSGQIRYQTGSGSIVECTDVFFNELVVRGETGHHECVRVASQTLLEKLSQLTLSVRNNHISVGVTLGVCECSYNFSEYQQGLVDVD